MERAPAAAVALLSMTERRAISRTIGILARRYAGRGRTASDRTVPFEVLIATILSARTKDETTIRVVTKLFRRYPTPSTLAKARPKEVERLIMPIGFYRMKAANIIGTSQALMERHEGRVPRPMNDLLSLPGVGRKTANIVRAVVFGEPAIAVDTHVHRISNRLGWIRTTTPGKSEVALERVVPDRWKRAINDTFVKFGKDICRPVRPQCWQCPVATWCRYAPKTTMSSGR